MMNSHLLRRTSRIWGLQPVYKDSTGKWATSPNSTLIETLSALTSHPVQNDQDLLHLIEKRKASFYEKGIEPVKAVWQSENAFLELYLSEKEKNQSAEFLITDENEQVISKGHFQTADRFQLPKNLPLGYLNLKIRFQNRELSTLIVSAPAKLPELKNLDRSWGPFLPLYAVRSEKDWGIGSLQELKTVGKELHHFGAKWVGVLPMLAGNFDPKDCDPSPYSALSRLFWNEIYLDVDKLVAKSQSQAALNLIQSPEFQKELSRLRSTDYVDYHAVYQQKKKILQILSQEFFSSQESSQNDYLEFKKLYPDLEGYTKFRSSELEGQNFHSYVQFQMHQSLKELSEREPFGLYMDYPVGVNDSGYDFHQYKDIFFKEVSVGAPPEPVFQLGQDWGFPSYHPHRLRETGYSYVRKTLETHLRYSKILRLDHVMGLHRVYVVPKGRSGKDGVYLRYKPEEFFAIACLEAHRANADLIGENLGTVPDAVNETLVKRNFKGMTVGEFIMDQSPTQITETTPKETLACVNTHDMPLFSAFLTGEDLDQVADLGILDKSFKESLKSDRLKAIHQWIQSTGKTPDQLIEVMVESLARSNARYLIVNIEDLWNEKRPQNIPGTYREVPNWRRKFSLAQEEWKAHPPTLKILNILKNLRPSVLP